ncbi:MAG: sigma-70 family RNA polymerase sigma factor [Acidobacteriota bacterium]
MADKPTGEITQLLADCRQGKPGAIDSLLPLVYDELRRLAAYYMKSERREHTLQPTALVHEAYAKLVDLEIEWDDRVQFFKAAAQAMRRILVDHARSKASAKRGGGVATLSLDETMGKVGPIGADIIDLDRALDRLAAIDARKAQVVELHFFAGLTFDETGKALEISRATVDRDMRMARAWLLAELSQEGIRGA